MSLKEKKKAIIQNNGRKYRRMMGLISLAVFILLGVVALWVKGIDEMHEKHPDYKGEDLFGEEEKNEKL